MKGNEENIKGQSNRKVGEKKSKRVRRDEMHEKRVVEVILSYEGK